jgi:glycine/serine hydroxymethyltransferase
MGSSFQNIYAEGYPNESTRYQPEAEILDYASQLAHYRRYADPRYYKGVEYADVVESLARRRCAEACAANGIGPDQIYVNVQALSGGPANNAVYHALVKPGDTLYGIANARLAATGQRADPGASMRYEAELADGTRHLSLPRGCRRCGSRRPRCGVRA